MPSAETAREALSEPGARIEAYFEEDGEWYPCTVEWQNDDGSLHVRWDNPGNGPEVSDCWLEDVRELVIVTDYTAGEPVRAVFPGDGAWYNGTVEGRGAGGRFRVHWDDPDGGPESSLCGPESVRKVDVFTDFRADDRVEALFPSDGQWYTGVVAGSNTDGTFEVRWDDPEEAGPESSACQPRYMKRVITYRDYQVGDVVDALDPSSGKWYPGVVGQLLEDGAFLVKWHEPEDGPEVCCCRAEGMKGVFRDYSVGDRVEARSPDDYDWHPGVVDRDLGGGAFEIRWSEPGHERPVSMCTPEEMVLVNDDQDDYEDWYADMMSEQGAYDDRGDDEYAQSPDYEEEFQAAELDEVPSVWEEDSRVSAFAAGAVPLEWKNWETPAVLQEQAQEEDRRELETVQLGGPVRSAPRAWTAWALSTLRLTLRPRRRGNRRIWWMRQPSRLSGWTSKRWSCARGEG